MFLLLYFLGDLISIYLEKNILNLTFEGNYVSALAAFGDKQTSYIEVDGGPSETVFSLGPISINLYYLFV